MRFVLLPFAAVERAQLKAKAHEHASCLYKCELTAYYINLSLTLITVISDAGYYPLQVSI